MSLTSFEAFPRMPFELQLMVWKFACNTGPMRLDLVNSESSWNESSHDFILPSQWHDHVITHQAGRLAVMHSCSAARQVALRQFSMVSCLDIPLFFSEDEQEDFRSGADTPEAEKSMARHIIVDWKVSALHDFIP